MSPSTDRWDCRGPIWSVVTYRHDKGYWTFRISRDRKVMAEALGRYASPENAERAANQMLEMMAFLSRPNATGALLR